MPLYEYKCDGCGEVFEVKQKFSDEPLTVHDKCGGHLERLISAPALQFKGTGWYVTDYAKGNGGAKKTSPESKTSGDSASKSDTKSSTESKPASSDKSKSD